MTSLDFISFIREAELEAIIRHLPRDGRVLEIGAGSGKQAGELQALGYDIAAIDLPSSNYAAYREFPIVEYNGHDIPFCDASFDAVFSSNVLEHVADLAPLYRDMKRVLKPGGICVHILPTHVWRTYSTLAAYPGALRRIIEARSRDSLRLGFRKLARAIFQTRHGERGNYLTESWYLRPDWWRRNFADNGFEVVFDGPTGLFYTSEEIRGVSFPVDERRRWARRLGSSTHLFVIKAHSANGAPAENR